MKQNRIPRLPDALAVAAGLLLLLAGGLLALGGWGGTFSPWENRNLAPRPGAPKLAAWRTDGETEAFLKDHVPLRQGLVAVDSSLRLLSGQGSRLQDWFVAGAMVQRPVQAGEAELERLDRKLDRLGRLAEQAGLPWYILTPPTHGSLITGRMSPWMAPLYQGEQRALDRVAATGHGVAMPAAFSADPDTMYYATDHHWTLAGAWQAYAALGDALGYEPLPLEAFRLSTFPGFQGTTLSGTGLPPLWRDTLACAEPASPVTLTVTDADPATRVPVTARFDRLIFPERAAEKDGYGVYLGGNHGLAVIRRPDAPEGTLVVFRDSFASCLLPLLSQHFREIIAVDARYFSGTFSEALGRGEDVRAILYLYSLDSLVNDTEITRKAR